MLLFKESNTMKKYFIAITFLAYSTFSTNFAFAEWDNGGISNVKVLSVTTLIDGSFYVYVDKDICDGGAVNKIGYVYVNSSPNGIIWSKEGASMLLKTALAAKLSGKSTKVFANDSGTGWGCKMGALAIQ